MTHTADQTHPRASVSAAPEQTSEAGIFVERRIGAARGGTGGGPTLVVIGGLHGNEPAGVLGLQRVFEALERDPGGLIGELVGLAGNRGGLAADRRFLERDLNRAWLASEVVRLTAAEGPLEAEEAEVRELARAIEEAVEAAAGEVLFLDVHSTSGGGAAFVSLDDTLANRALALSIPSPHVLGLEEELAGTLVGWLNARGHTAIGFESGQHRDPSSVDRAEAAIWLTMESAGVLRSGVRPEATRARKLLLRDAAGLPDVLEVRYRHPVHDRSLFEMLPGFANFQRVRRGEPLAQDHGRTVPAPERGRMLMPLYQGLGEDGFFIVRSVSIFWLRLSRGLRLLQCDRFLHLLPGVDRDPLDPAQFTVDRRRARWLALQVFHLLGYRRAGRTEHVLLMRKRDLRRVIDGSSGRRRS